MIVVWSAEAARQLRDIVDYIGMENPEAARRVAARLLLRSKALAEPPPEGRRLPEYPDTDLRELLERPYRIIYRTTTERIEVIAIKHYRQRLPSSPGQLPAKR